MREFERQENNGCNIIVDCKDIKCRDCKKIKKAIWRAALELVLGWLDYSIEHKEIKDKIHDELEND